VIILTTQRCGFQFANDEEVRGMMHIWLHVQLKTFFSDDIRKFMDQSNKYVEKLEDYIEKWQYICSCVPFVE
jgi:hypothetical protein